MLLEQWFCGRKTPVSLLGLLVMLLHVNASQYVVRREGDVGASENNALAVRHDGMTARSVHAATASGTPDQGTVQAWLKKTLKPGMNYATYSPVGGMGSARQEVLNAMLIARAMNIILVLSDAKDINVPLRTAYDITLMRSMHLSSADVGSTFAWTSELQAAGVHTDSSKCVALQIPNRKDVRQPVDDLVRQVLLANGVLQGRLKSSTSICVKIGQLDGTTGWTQDTSQCQKNKHCSALFQAFHLSPSVSILLATKKKAIDSLLHGKMYSCFHVNSFWCDFKLPAGKTWDSCMTELMQAALFNNTFVSKSSNFFVVGQRDSRAAPILKKLLQGVSVSGGKLNGATVFTLADVGMPSTDLQDPHYNMLDPAYATRGAVSWGLCSPGYAQTYVGEAWSGFTYGLLTNGLVNSLSRGQWSMMIYGNKFSGSGGPPSKVASFNYFNQMIANGERIPPWIISPPWVQEEIAMTVRKALVKS